MRGRLRTLFFAIVIVCLFICTSVVPAFNIDLKDRICDIVETKVESFIDYRVNESYPSIPYSYDDVMNPNLGYEMIIGNDRYGINPYDELDKYHDEYLERNEELMEKYDDITLNHLDNSPSERPDFENGTTWYVDDEPGEGPDNPPEDFTSIQDAYNIAENGDIIFIQNGKYVENLIINKSLKIIGENKEMTLIDSNFNFDTFLISSNWTIISNLTFIESERSIYLYYSSNCTIRNNSFFSSGGIMIYGNLKEHWNSHQIVNNTINNVPIKYYKNEKNLNITGEISQLILANCHNLFINNISLKFNYIGIIVAFSSNNLICNNNFSNNLFSGILFEKSSDNLLINNSFHNNFLYGIHLSKSENNTLRNNYFYEIDCCIRLYESKQNLLDENFFLNGEFCIILVLSCFNDIINNNFYIIKNENRVYRYGYGIKFFRYSNNNLVKHNIFDFDFNKDGIYIQDSSENKIISNHLVNNSNGILLTNSHENFVQNNYCMNNSIEGIGIISNSNSNTIVSNICNRNMKGISIRSSMNNTIYQNNCRRNQQGILLNNIFNTKVEYNDLERNGVGIYLYKTINNMIKNNNIKHNKHKGITLRQYSMFNIFENNDIGPWNYQGIYVENSHFNKIHNNNISMNNDDGIGLVQTIGNKIYNNNIFGNTNYAIEGTLCLVDARNNYWGEEPPKRWIFTNEEDADIYTPGGFVAILPYLRETVDIAS